MIEMTVKVIRQQHMLHLGLHLVGLVSIADSHA